MSHDPKQFEKTKHYTPEISNFFDILSLENDEDHIYLRSIDQQIFSIKTNLLINFLFKNNMALEKNTINYEFIIDVNNIPRTIHEYNEWGNKVKKDTLNKYEKEDLIIGKYYKLDDKDEFLYLGDRYIVSWKINKNGKLEVTKPSRKYLGQIVYDVKDPHIYEGNLIDLNSAKYKKRTIIKEISGKKINTENILSLFSYQRNWLYFKKEKPSFKVLALEDIDMKEVSPKELKDISDKYDYSFFNIFHYTEGYYLSNRVYITDDFVSDRDYSRQFSRSSAFDIELDGKGMDYFNSYSGSGLVASITSRCSENENFRMAPDNYYFLTIREEGAKGKNS